MKNKYLISGIIISTLIILIGVIIYGGLNGWFKINLNIGGLNVGGDTINLLNSDIKNSPAGSRCDISLSDDRICVGDSITGVLNDGANDFCWIYAYITTEYTEGWQLITEGFTNNAGVLTETQTIDIEGTARFRAVCDINGNNVPDTGDCISNYADLVVEDCSSPSDDGDCSDSDGGIEIRKPGHVTLDGISYYDKCLEVGEAVTEYYCEDGIVKNENWMCDYGEICFATRSGDYCVDAPDITYTCGNVDGQCGGTCPPTHSTCDKMYTGLYTWSCACIDESSMTVHEDWKPDGLYFDEVDGTPPIEHFCENVDSDNSIWGAGYCRDAYGIYYDYCIDNNDIREYRCKYAYETGDNTCRYNDLGCDAYTQGGISAQCIVAQASDGGTSAECSW